MSTMISGEGEEVKFSEKLYPEGNVEVWLGDVERVMRESVRKQIELAVADYPLTPRTEWVLNWPGTFTYRIFCYFSKLIFSHGINSILSHRNVINVLDHVGCRISWTTAIAIHNINILLYKMLISQHKTYPVPTLMRNDAVAIRQ